MWSNSAFVIYYIWLYRKRHLITTFVQIIGPILIIIVFTLNSHQQYTKVQIKEFNQMGCLSEDALLDSVINNDCPSGETSFVAYHSNQKDKRFADEMVNLMARTSFTKYPNLKFQWVDEEEDVIKFGVIHHAMNRKSCYIGGLVFENDPLRMVGNSSRYLVKLKVKIRMASFIPYEVGSVLMHTVYFDPKFPRDYSPFLGFQIALTKAFNLLYGKRSYDQNLTDSDLIKLMPNISVGVKSFPLKDIYRYKFKSDQLYPLHVIVAVGLVLGQVFMVMSIVWGPAYDKQTGFRTYLRFVGVSRETYWSSWWLNDFIIRLAVSGLQVVVLFSDLSEANPRLIQRGNQFIWFIFLVSYNMASISYFICAASFYKRGLMATYLSATTWLLNFYVSDLFLSSQYFAVLNRIGKCVMCLNPNSALLLGCLVMTTTVEGIQYESLTKLSEQHGITMLEILLILVADAFLYFIFTLYGDALRPDRYGTKFWQHCSTSFRIHTTEWVKRKKKSFLHLFRGDYDDSLASEYVPGNDVIFTNVTFGFEKKRPVLEEVCLQIMDRKFTAIVGPRGSGKTTIARLICGCFPPTSGFVKIGGHDSITGRSKTREILGICPKQNLLCDYMTLREHVKLVGRLRGFGVSRVRRKSKKILEALDLTPYSEEFPPNLVGIQRRKLCIALALIGSPKVVVFDDPTRGMDLESTIQILKFIAMICNGKTTLLLTSNLSEAYYVAERIAILANGRILGSGTKAQLESCLSNTEKLKQFQLNLRPNTDPEEVLTLIRRLVPTAQKLEKQSHRIQAALALVENEFNDCFLNRDFTPRSSVSSHDIFLDAMSRSRSRAVTVVDYHLPEYDDVDGGIPTSNDLTVVLPSTEVTKFTKLFKLLESDLIRKDQGIISYKLLPYTIEIAYDEVENYMRLNEAKEELEMKKELEETTEQLLTQHHVERVRCKGFHRLKALVVKRVAYMYSVWLNTILQFAVPAVVLLLTIAATAHSFEASVSGPKVDDSLSRFIHPKALVKPPSITDSLDVQNLYSRYKNLIGSHRIEEVSSFDQAIASLDDPEMKMSSVYVVGAEILPDKVIALFSPIAFNAAPASLSLVLNAYLQKIHTFVHVKFIGHPINSRTEEMLKYYHTSDTNHDSSPALMLTLILSFGIFVYVSRFICQPLAERTILLKNLQLSTGLSAFTYWVGYFLCDVCCTVVLTGILIVIELYACPHKGFSDPGFISMTALFLFIAGLSSTLHSYAWSFIFIQPNTSFFAMLSYNQFAGIFLYVTSTFFHGTEKHLVSLVFRIFQPYNVPSGMHNLILVGIHNAGCDLMHSSVRDAICNTNWTRLSVTWTGGLDRSCCDYFKTGNWIHRKDFLTWKIRFEDIHDTPLVDFLFLVFHGVLCGIYISFMEGGCRCRNVRKQELINSNKLDAMDGKEDDESSIVPAYLPRGTFKNERYLYVSGVSKRFFLGREVITDISLSAGPGDLVGIVGPSKAGKTVFMKILTGSYTFTRGLIQFKQPFHPKRLNYHKYMGSTPSGEMVSVFPHMKGATLLKLFARLRGVPDSQLEDHLHKWTTLLGLQKKLNQKCEYYTTAVRSKLALALALVGDPPILVLDEPLQGVDPFTKHQFWIIVDYLRKETGRIVIMATTNIQEIAARSTKLMIIVNGSVQSYSSPEHLVQEHAGGLLVTFKLREGSSFQDWSTVKARVHKDLPTSVLHVESVNVLVYKISQSAEEGAGKTTLSWSTIFHVCHGIRQAYPSIITEYQVSEETIQDIYSTLASKQLPYNQPQGSREEFCKVYC